MNEMITEVVNKYFAVEKKIFDSAEILIGKLSRSAIRRRKKLISTLLHRLSAIFMCSH